ncbi:hypothetical protein EKK58_01845 [Candidatus Dependentiae bacterium]|nr:MAG: hypothetical protein EKK58_01845 [Candidatus Dependentiae bacterium]
MQDYILFLTLSILFFTCDMLTYCVLDYQITYTVLLYYCFLLIKKSSISRIGFVFFLLTVQSWFVYDKALLALTHLPFAYCILYRHHNYLYFNTFLFTIIACGSFLIQLLIEYIMLNAHIDYYIYYKISGMLTITLCSMYAIHICKNKANKRQ